jgi:hypothetical protein
VSGPQRRGHVPTGGGAATDGGRRNAAPSDLAGWGLHCFSPTARRTPHSIVELDNNGEILAAAVSPVHPEDLAASGIPVTDSQIRLLCDNGVLIADNEMIRTAGPVLGPAVIGPIRERLEDVSHGVVDRLGEPVGAVRAALTAAGHSDSVWAVTFGHALDGLLWIELDARGHPPQAVVVVAHELIWTVTNALVAQGIVELPPLLSTGGGPLRDVVYLT